MKEFSREQVIKALECCYTSGTSCNTCPLYELDNCNDVLMAGYVRNLIKELTEEIERLRAENEQWRNDWERNQSQWEEAYDKLKTDTVKKMQEAIIKYYSQPKYQPTPRSPIKHTMIDHLFTVIDQIAKEILEEINND